MLTQHTCSKYFPKHLTMPESKPKSVPFFFTTTGAAILAVTCSCAYLLLLTVRKDFAFAWKGTGATAASRALDVPALLWLSSLLSIEAVEGV